MRALYRCFREDRLLFALTLAMAALCLAPLAATSIPPLIDLPHHVGLASLLWDVVLGRGSAGHYFKLNGLPTPYWTAYLLLAPFVRALGAYTGTKVVLALCALSVPLGAIRLLLALGKSPRLGLWAFLLIWDFNLYYGWINHVLGMGLALFALALVIEAETPRDAMRVWPAGVVLAWTHLLPFGFFGLAASLAALVRPGLRRRVLTNTAIALAAPTLALVPWLARSLVSAGRHVDPGFRFDAVNVKLTYLFTYSLGNGLLSASGLQAAGIAFLVLLFGPVFLFLLKQRTPRMPGALAAVPLVTALLLYFMLPLSVSRPVAHWGTYPRFCTPALLGLLFLPSPRLTGLRGALALAPGLLAGALLFREVTAQFRAFDAALRPFYEIARHVPRGAALLPLCYENKFPMVRLPLGESLHGYITADTGGFNPSLFDQETNPIQYRADARLPAPAAWDRRPELFSMARHGQYYDYILVLGSSADPVRDDPEAAGKKAELILARERYRLYAVRPAAQ